MEELTIGEVAKRAGIRASAVRYYESVGILPMPRRISGQRRYDAGVLSRLMLIQVAQQAGFTIAEIQTLFDGFDADVPASARWQALASQKLMEIDALIKRAQGMKHLLEEGLLRCGCVTLEECALHFIEKQDAGEAIASC